MTSTALVMTEEQALAALGQMDLTPRGYAENVQQEDIAQPPRLRIAHNARDNVQEGCLYNSVTGKSYGKVVEAVFLIWETKTRVKWPKDYHKDNDPMCASDDAVMPRQSTDQRPLTNPQRGPCDVCPDAQWGPNGERPRCSKQRNCILWLVDDEEPIRLTLQVSSIGSGKILSKLSKTCNVMKSIYVTTEKGDEEKGHYYIYLFTEGKKQPFVKALELKQLADALELTVMADDAENDNFVPDADAPIIDGSSTQIEDDVPF